MKPGGEMALRVLLIEDNPDHALLTRLALERHGEIGEVEILENGERALERLRGGPEPRPDAILVDLKLPGLSGFQLLERLKATEGLREIPVVILSTSAREDEIARGLEIGARAFLTKPIRVDEFVDCVRDRP